jgi:hypothetical protein
MSSDILGVTYRNKLHVANVVSTIQIGAYLAFNPKTLGQHVALDKQENSK